MKRLALLVVSMMALGAAPASAGHSWGGYHWARTANPFTLGLDNNLKTAPWQGLGGSVSVDWTKSSVLDTPLSGPKTDNKRCKASSGRDEVCNDRYGRNGWLGLAQIWISGGHIVQGVVKVNDTYLDSGYSAVNKQHVLCQEVGHTLGLDHQDESGADLDTCMDYANALDNPSPNAHDYTQLETIYNQHLDSTSTVATVASTQSARGRMKRVSNDVYVEEVGGGGRIVTFVFWQDRRAPHGPPDVGE